MPATFVLSGVRSPRTYASSVICSILPPSQAFQSRVTVIKTARASSTTTKGVTYFCHLVPPRGDAVVWIVGGAELTTGEVDSEETGEADIRFAPSKARDWKAPECSRRGKCKYAANRERLFERPKSRVCATSNVE